MWQEYFHNQVFMSAGWNAEALEPHAYHKAEDLNNDDDASMHGHSDSFMVELRIDEFQDMKAMKEHTKIIGTEAKIVKQASSWRPAGITWIRAEPKAVALTPNTAANTSDETSWDRAKARSCAGGIWKLSRAQQAGLCL